MIIKNNKGMTFIEVSIILAVISAIMVLSVNFFAPMIYESRTKTDSTMLLKRFAQLEDAWKREAQNNKGGAWYPCDVNIGEISDLDDELLSEISFPEQHIDNGYTNNKIKTTCTNSTFPKFNTADPSDIAEFAFYFTGVSSKFCRAYNEFNKITDAEGNGIILADLPDNNERTFCTQVNGSYPNSIYYIVEIR